MIKHAEEIFESIKRTLEILPPSVKLAAAVKHRTQAEVEAVIEAGVTHIGHNFEQEAEEMIPNIYNNKVTWRMIGHLQRNKAKKQFDSLM